MFFQGHGVVGNSAHPQHQNSHCTPTASSGGSTSSSLGSRMSYVSGIQNLAGIEWDSGCG